ncbi:DUF3035 domain-containing protein [uncultured Ferrovibrio sp.]|uniref:DUF3035 domain-containing protein n=1 Tax=uncultured Ferrovibrio sp. TaxID=1576913 RepID=UPI00262A85F6|nr:DUF3035 domain-containing protein [uncultured Ferrovibrio sp.]
MPFAVILACPLILAGCDSTREALGLNKKSPDEFAVVTKAPLVLPPEFGLRPPEPGAPRPQDIQARDRAQAALGGRTVTSPLTSAQRNPTSSVSAGEAALLQQARATSVDPDIRRKVNEDFTQLAERDRSFVDRLIFWQEAEPPGLAVDPVKEAQRLRENAATGKSVTAGDVPTIKRRERGPLEGIF